MAQRAVNEKEYFAKTVANHLGALLISDVIRQGKFRDIIAPDATTYWLMLKEEANSLRQSGLTPVLVLDNPTRPAWVWDWQHPSEDSEYVRPSDLVIRHVEKERGHRYIADFNDIQVFSSPLAPGESLLLPREAFTSVTFRKYRDNVFVKADVAEVRGSRTLVDLRLTYERRVRVEHNKVVRIRYEIANSVPE